MTETQSKLLLESVANLWGTAYAITSQNRQEAQAKAANCANEAADLLERSVGNRKVFSEHEARLFFAACCRRALEILGEPPTL